MFDESKWRFDVIVNSNQRISGTLSVILKLLEILTMKYQYWINIVFTVVIIAVKYDYYRNFRAKNGEFVFANIFTILGVGKHNEFFAKFLANDE